MIAHVKMYKAGFVSSDSNIRPDQTLEELTELIKTTGHSTVAVTENGQHNGKLVGIITERDFRINHCPPHSLVATYMTPLEKLIKAETGISLDEANDLIWQHKINQLPVLFSISFSARITPHTKNIRLSCSTTGSAI